MARMILWILFAAMTGAAIFAVLWPLSRDPRQRRGGTDVLVYKDQLAEIERDRAAGLIGEAEADAARLELSRRLLAAADAQQAAESTKDAATPSVSASPWRRRTAALAALIILPLGPVGLYLALGSPTIPGQSAFARAGTPAGHASIDELVAQVEAHLARNPNDGSGWEVLAPVYMRLGRYDDAVIARRKALALNGETAARESDLGEALAAAGGGIVTADAKVAFDRAVANDPHEPKARYFLGLAAEQDGKPEEAAAIWRSLIAQGPADAPWLDFVRRALGQVTGEPIAKTDAGPTATEVADAGNLSDDQRADMVRGMVARLSDRLHADGGDVEGWLRLVRAYVVLGEREKARGAASDARRALADHPDEIKRIDDLVKGLGLEG